MTMNKVPKEHKYTPKKMQKLKYKSPLLDHLFYLKLILGCLLKMGKEPIREYCIFTYYLESILSTKNIAKKSRPG